MFGSILGLMQWIQLGQKVIEAGVPAFNAIRNALAAQGIEADMAALEADIIEGERRKAIADAEAQATS